MFNSVSLRGFLPGLHLVGAVMLAFGVAGATSVQPARAAAPKAAQAPAQQDFASTDEALAALIKALESGDTKALLGILGPGSEKLVVSGDPVADENGRKRFLDSYAAAHTLTPQADGRATLVIGENAWPWPIPLVQANDRWHFDATTGAQEIINRRIGRNELETIRTLLTAVEAEKDYFDRLKRGAGTGAYAERFLSTADLQDGLYWEVDAGEAPSPLGPLVEQAEDEGYPGADSASGKQVPYHGYMFRILKAQGPNAPGGAKDYVKGGQMTEGFAIVAWPAQYEGSGVVTFLVDQDGVVFQKDLGPATAKIAASMTRFDPDFTWARVDIKD